MGDPLEACVQPAARRNTSIILTRSKTSDQHCLVTSLATRRVLVFQRPWSVTALSALCALQRRGPQQLCPHVPCKRRQAWAHSLRGGVRAACGAGRTRS
jgi:hypothetical protein